MLLLSEMVIMDIFYNNSVSNEHCGGVTGVACGDDPTGLLPKSLPGLTELCSEFQLIV